MTAGPVFCFSVVGRETEAEGKTITREHCEASTGRPVPAAAVPKPLSPPPRAASHPANAEICHPPVRPSARLSPFRDSCTKTLDKIPSLL